MRDAPVQAHLAGKYPWFMSSSRIPAAITSCPADQSDAVVLSKEKQCSRGEESLCEMLFLQIFIIVVRYLYLATFSL